MNWIEKILGRWHETQQENLAEISGEGEENWVDLISSAVKEKTGREVAAVYEPDIIGEDGNLVVIEVVIK